MIVEFDWFSHDGVKNVLSMIYSILDVIRIVVPIILVVMTSLDISKKVINPDDKEGQKKILTRLIAAIIIFFLPTIINLVLGIANIEVPNVNVDNNGQNNDKPKEIELPNLKITNCPNSLIIYHNNESITLNTNIPSTYKESIVWSIEGGNSFVKTKPTNGRKSLDVDFYNIFSSGKVVIKVTAGGSNDTCTVNLDKEKLASLSYTNCPGIQDTNNAYYVGDSITLMTDIPSNFNGDITWSSDDDSAVLIRKSSDKKSAIIDILDAPKVGHVIISTIAGSKSNVCLLNIYAVKELKITNCPDQSNVYHVGDVIKLDTNLPSYFKGVYSWGSSIDPNIAKVNVLDNGRSAEIRIVGVPSSNYLYVSVAADSDAKVTNCKINIKDINDTSPVPTVIPTLKPVITPVPTVKPTIVPTVRPTIVPTVRPTIAPTIKPTPTSTPAPTYTCSPEGSPYLTNVTSMYCNDIYLNYKSLLLGAEQNLKNGKYYRYYGCIKNISNNKYNVYECIMKN